MNIFFESNFLKCSSFTEPDKSAARFMYTVRKFLADFAVLYVTDHAIAKLYVM